MSLRDLVQQVKDEPSLIKLLQEGLGWPILDNEKATRRQAQIAEGVNFAGGEVSVRRLRPIDATDTRPVFIVDFEGSIYLRRDLRALLRSVRRFEERSAEVGATGVGDTLFIVAQQGWSDVRFVLFEEQERRLPRIRSFGWEKSDVVGRTVLTHNLACLRWGEEWIRAWDVEGLTEEFYREFERVFNSFKKLVDYPGDDILKHAYVQTLFNRLLFLAFVERRGWLITPEGDTDYMHGLWLRHKSVESYDQLGVSPEHLYNSFHSVMERVFALLDMEPRHRDLSGRNAEDALVFGTVPYLNGGLFHEDVRVEVSGVKVPDDAFRLIFDQGGLFRRFNFTVTESTPLDQVVAVDPEMLGRVFERLVNDRHEEGKYYTPRPIVDFMVNECVKNYLVERGVTAEKAALLVERETLREAESDVHIDADETDKILELVTGIRAVDPACGSGAYLLGILQKLFTLGYVLRWRSAVKDMQPLEAGRFLYKRKLELVQRCVYGVDADSTAVRIARLRLWLSLAIENVAGEAPIPLPYLDFKVDRGDSLMFPLAWKGQGTAESEYITQFLQQRRIVEDTTERYTDDQRADALVEARRARHDLQSFADLYADNAFPWQAAFYEVFHRSEPSKATLQDRLNLGPEGGAKKQGELYEHEPKQPGFDIVVANPPYVRYQTLRPIRAKLQKAFPEVYEGAADLLVYFFERSVQILRPGGQLAFITSNKWLKSSYGHPLRRFLSSSAEIRELLNYNGNEVFTNMPGAMPLVTIAQKRKSESSAIRAFYTDVPRVPHRELKMPAEARVKWGRYISESALADPRLWELERHKGASSLNGATPIGRPLKEYVKGRIRTGINTGMNTVTVDEAGNFYTKGEKSPPGSRKVGVFVLTRKERDEIVQRDSASSEIIKPLVVGRDVRKWFLDTQDRWLILTKNGTDMSRYPGVMEHLVQFRTRLEVRTARGDNWWNLRPCAYWDEFESSKIVLPDIADGARGTIAPPGTYINNSGYIISCADLHFVLALLNSRPVIDWYRRLTPKMKDDFIRFNGQFLDQIPVPNCSFSDKQVLQSLVQRIFDLKECEATDRLVQELRSGTSEDLDVSSIRALHGEKDIPAQIAELEAEIDRRVEFLYFHQDEAPTYDEWITKTKAEEGTSAEAVRKLIAGDESGTVEFKETLEFVDRIPESVPENRRNEWKANKQKECVEGVLKTICAFQNSKGGTLLIGVSDRKEVVGLTPDFSMLGNKQNRDGFELKLKELLKRIRPLPTDLEIDFPDLDGKMICRVVAPASSTPHYLDNRLFIRFGNASEELSGRDLQDWLQKRQGVET